MSTIETLAEIIAAQDHRAPAATLDRLSEWLAQRSGQLFGEVRFHRVRGWCLKLYPFCDDSERDTVRVLLDATDIAVHTWPDETPISAIDNCVLRYIAIAQEAAARATSASARL